MHLPLCQSKNTVPAFCPTQYLGTDISALLSVGGCQEIRLKKVAQSICTDFAATLQLLCLNVKPNDPTKLNVSLSKQPQLVTTEEVLNIMNRAAKRAEPKGR
jgi:hypothetical protein